MSKDQTTTTPQSVNAKEKSNTVLPNAIISIESAPSVDVAYKCSSIGCVNSMLSFGSENVIFQNLGDKTYPDDDEDGANSDWFESRLESNRNSGTSVREQVVVVGETNYSGIDPNSEQASKSRGISFEQFSEESIKANDDYSSDSSVSSLPPYTPTHHIMKPGRSILKRYFANSSDSANESFVTIPEFQDAPSESRFAHAVDSLTNIRGSVAQEGSSTTWRNRRGDLSPGVVCCRNNFRSSTGIDEVTALVSETHAGVPVIDHDESFYSDDSSEEYVDAVSTRMSSFSDVSCRSVCSSGSCVNIADESERETSRNGQLSIKIVSESTLDNNG